MKSELRLAPHAVLAGAGVVEIWYDDQFIGEVVGLDGPGIRVLSKHRLRASLGGSDRISISTADNPINLISVKVEP